MGFPKVGWSLQNGHGVWESTLVFGPVFVTPRKTGV